MSYVGLVEEKDFPWKRRRRAKRQVSCVGGRVCGFCTRGRDGLGGPVRAECLCEIRCCGECTVIMESITECWGSSTRIM